MITRPIARINRSVTTLTARGVHTEVGSEGEHNREGRSAGNRRDLAGHHPAGRELHFRGETPVCRK